LKKIIDRFLCLALSMLITNSVFADTWTGNADTNWFNAANWASGNVPGFTTDITVDNPAVNSPIIGASGALAQNISLGVTSTGTLTINAGGQLSANSADVGIDSSSSGTIVIGGANSIMNMLGPLTIGDSGSGTLDLGSGAVVNNAAGDIGAQASGSGTVVMEGSGTVWSNAGALTVGDLGSGTLVFGTGSVLKSISAIAGNSGSGTIIISDPGTQWLNSGGMIIANGANSFADMDISNGAAVLSSGDVILANQVNSFGGVTLENPGTQWLNSGDLTVASGAGSFGSIGISDGAVFSAANAIFAVQSGSSATITIQDPGTVWTNSSMVIGEAGIASVTLFNSAILNVTDAAGITIGAGSVLNIGAADGSLAVAGGQLNATNIFLNDTANIFFNHTDSSNVVNANISGAGAITQEGSGTTVLNGNNSYTGGTTISAGTLQGTSNGLQGNIVNNSHLVFDQTFNGVFTGVISGSGDVTKNNSGALLLQNPNTYTGNTVITQGTLTAGSNNILPNTPLITIAPNATFDLAGFSQTVNNLQNNGLIAMSPVSNASQLGNNLVVNNFSGNGSMQMTTDFANNSNDLLIVNGTSSGQQKLILNNPQQNVDPAVGAVMTLVQTADGVATFSGGADGGTFQYVVSRGNGSAVAPDPDDWYLVRLDLLNSGLGGGSSIPIKDILTSTATAAISMFSASVPLFYSDMTTLTARMGDLRLGDTSGAWIRSFGNKMQIDNQISRPFNQNTGGLQAGYDKAMMLNASHLNLGVFTDYMYAAQQFHQNATGATQNFSLGAYATWLQPNGWYADVVAKYSEYWNDFQATTFNGLPSRAYYRTPALGGSLEVGKKIIFATSHALFIEPQIQLTTAWIDAVHYQASNGLQINGGNQTSLEGRIGLRSGLEFNLNKHRAIEPYLQVALLQEFHKYNTITTNTTSFQTQLPQTIKRFGAGIATRLAEKAFLYGEYYYAVGKNFREPVALNIGLRVTW
jgi:outer membrane autotransporter protein